jgi:membrane protein YdbS with pleckstrin-like domain
MDATAAQGLAGEPEELHRLEPRVVVYWWVTGLMGTAMMLAMALGLVWFAGEHQWTQLRWWRIGALGLTALHFAWSVIAPPLAYARWRYRVGDDLLLMRYGIFFHEERLVPVRRMQHVDLTRGPIERLFGLATLVVFTAGNEGSAFRVPGLSVMQAQAMRDHILRARGDDVI